MKIMLYCFFLELIPFAIIRKNIFLIFYLLKVRNRILHFEKCIQLVFAYCILHETTVDKCSLGLFSSTLYWCCLYEGTTQIQTNILWWLPLQGIITPANNLMKVRSLCDLVTGQSTQEVSDGISQHGSRVVCLCGVPDRVQHAHTNREQVGLQ